MAHATAPMLAGSSRGNSPGPDMRITGARFLRAVERIASMISAFQAQNAGTAYPSR
jgi:hypothetical protein